jgi:hypothetical protein
MVRDASEDFVVQLLRRGFTKLVEEISEPLMTQKLETGGFQKWTDLVKQVRKKGRNETTHNIRPVEDSQSHFDGAVASLSGDLTHLFEILYSNVRKTVVTRLEAKSGITIETHLANMKKSVKKEKDWFEVGSFLTVDSRETGRPTARVRTTKDIDGICFC